MILLELWLDFFKIGLFCFGGGYGMISMLAQEAVSRGWMSLSEFTDIVAISQITPGPLAVNMATFVGYLQSGISGALAATAGVAMPSLILVLALMRILNKFNDNKYVKYIFMGLRPAVAGLIFAACLQIAELEFFRSGTAVSVANIEFKSVLLFAVAFTALYKNIAKPIPVIIASAAAGLIIF